MATTVAGSGAYLLGHAAEEQQRLDEQGANLRPATERLLRDAGVGPGMRVLDVGCGTGDVTLLAAAMVGPTGVVFGVDRSTDVLATARSRVPRHDVAQVLFVEGDIASIGMDEPFDAVIGRQVLIHQRDPTAVVRHLAELVRPGGVIAFAEQVIMPDLVWPPRPLYSQSVTWCKRALEGGGLVADMGLHLHTVFTNAGLPAPQLRLDGVITAGADASHQRWLAATVRTLLPLMERLGIAGPAQVEGLEQRLIEEAATMDGTACGLALTSAWTRRPPTA